MEQTLKYVGNSAMLSVSPKSIRQKRIDRTTRLEQIDNGDDENVISFRIIRPAGMEFPKIKGELNMSPEIEALINDPVYPGPEQMNDPRIKAILDEDIR